jgi:hypothetical protein
VYCVRQVSLRVVEARAAECGVEARAVVECAAPGCLECMGDERVESSTAPARWPAERSMGDAQQYSDASAPQSRAREGGREQRKGTAHA